MSGVACMRRARYSAALQEKKKLRKQRREEREREKQQNIQLGLMEPPKDKVRLSNMARVYGAAGVVDATAIELKVRAAQEERQRAHEDRNAARKLTTAERKEKKMKKLFDDEAADTIVQARPWAPLPQRVLCALTLLHRSSAARATAGGRGGVRQFRS